MIPEAPREVPLPLAQRLDQHPALLLAVQPPPSAPPPPLQLVQQAQQSTLAILLRIFVGLLLLLQLLVIVRLQTLVDLVPVAAPDYCPVLPLQQLLLSRWNNQEDVEELDEEEQPHIVDESS